MLFWHLSIPNVNWSKNNMLRIQWKDRFIIDWKSLRRKKFLEFTTLLFIWYNQPQGYQFLKSRNNLRNMYKFIIIIFIIVHIIILYIFIRFIRF